MMLYRFARAAFSNDLTGEGARLFGGRWNSKGTSAVYASLSISLSLLELLIHSVSYEEILSNDLLSLETGSLAITEISAAQLKEGWQQDEEYTRYIGDEFLHSLATPLLKIPSVIIPEEYNMLINPKHADSKKIKLKSHRDFSFDARLFK